MSQIPLNAACFDPNVVARTLGLVGDSASTPQLPLTLGKPFTLQNTYFATVPQACLSCSNFSGESSTTTAGLWQTLGTAAGAVSDSAPATTYQFQLSSDGKRLLLRMSSPPDATKPYIAFMSASCGSVTGYTPWQGWSEADVTKAGASWGLVKSSRGGTYLLYQNVNMPAAPLESAMPNPGIVAPCGMTDDQKCSLPRIPAPRQPPTSPDANAAAVSAPCSASPTGLSFATFVFDPVTLIACDPVQPPDPLTGVPCTPASTLTPWASGPTCQTCNCTYAGVVANAPTPCPEVSPLGMGVRQSNQFTWVLVPATKPLLSSTAKIGLYILIAVCAVVIIVVCAVLVPRIVKAKKEASNPSTFARGGSRRYYTWQ